MSIKNISILLQMNTLNRFKIKFGAISLVDEIAERQGKAINVEISGDKVLVDTNKYSNFITVQSTFRLWITMSLKMKG